MMKKKCNVWLHPHSGLGEESREECIHAKKAIDLTTVKKKLKLNGLEKQCLKCVKEKTLDLVAGAGDGGVQEEPMPYELCLWLCLQCGTQLCGRYRNQHALAHYKTPRSEPHSLAMNTTRFDVWCYQCHYEVNPKSVPKLLDCVEFVKREAEKVKVGPPVITNTEQKLLTMADDLRAIISDAVPIPVASGSTVTSSTMGLASGQNRPQGTNLTAPLTTPNYRDLRLDIYRDPNAAILDGLCYCRMAEAKIQIERLNNFNWASWKFRMELLLVKDDLYDTECCGQNRFYFSSQWKTA